MNPPETRQRPAGGPGEAQDTDLGESAGTPHRSRDRSPTLAYLDGRERVLGHRVTLPEDPSAAADTLAEIHGGRRRAAAWLRRVLSEVVAP